MTSALALTLLLVGPTSTEKGIQWEDEFDRALEVAQKDGKPVLVDFWAEWCGYCHRLDRTTYADPVVGKMAKNFVAVKVNTEGRRRELEIARRYRIRNLPTILFLSSRGRQVWRVDSFIGPGRFPYVMEKALQTAQRVSVWEEALEQDPDDAGAAFALGQHLWDQECFEESEELLAQAAAHDGDRPAYERRRTRLLLAMLQSVRHRYAEAESLIKEALSLDPTGPDQPKLLFMLGRNYMSWGRQEQGMRTMEAIVREHPQSPIAQKAKETLVILERK
ncbi:MAG: thioredoxin family protein [Acidobacteriota bacterium]|jgi:thiol-disulfide isomerase/thioredoxin